MNDILKENIETKQQIHEEIVQEIFRQILVKNDIAGDYIIQFNDDYEYQEEELGPFGNAVYVFNDNNNTWNVWEDEPYELFQGYIRGMHTDFKQYTSQEEAYIDAAKREDINISEKDLKYDINDAESMLNIVKSAKKYLKFGVDFYRVEGKQSKLWHRYLLLDAYEKELLEKTNSIHNELVKKKK